MTWILLFLTMSFTQMNERLTRLEELTWLLTATFQTLKTFLAVLRCLQTLQSHCQHCCAFQSGLVVFLYIEFLKQQKMIYYSYSHICFYKIWFYYLIKMSPLPEMAGQRSSRLIFGDKRGSSWTQCPNLVSLLYYFPAPFPQ